MPIDYVNSQNAAISLKFQERFALIFLGKLTNWQCRCRSLSVKCRKQYKAPTNPIRKLTIYIDNAGPHCSNICCPTSFLINTTIFFGFSSLFISFCNTFEKNWKKKDKNSLFKREDKSCIITVKSNRSWWYYVSCHSQHILSHKVVESKENFIKIWTKIEQKQHWILTFFFWGFYLEYYSYFGCL